MEGPISFWGYKEQESNLILPEHDDDDDDEKKIKTCMRAVEWTGALMQISWSARSVIVTATVTQHTCSVNGVSLPTD